MLQVSAFSKFHWFPAAATAAQTWLIILTAVWETEVDSRSASREQGRGTFTLPEIVPILGIWWYNPTSS